MTIDLDDDEDTVRRQRRVNERLAPATLAVTWSAHSSIGLRRQDNQDAWGQDDGCRFVVADGVGGILGGAVASRVAVAHFLAAQTPIDWSAMIREINTEVLRECSERNHAGAATTLVGLHISAATVTVTHVGDSRCYVLRDGSLLCLTEDHNVANLRRTEGQDPRVADSRGKPRSLTSYLGAGDDHLDVGVLTFTLRPADRLLLCTDGVHEQLAAHHLATILGSLPVAKAAEQLVAAADAAGGRDNATAVVIELQSR